MDIKRKHKTPSGDSRLGMLLKRAEQAMVRVKGVALKPIGLTLAQYVALAELDVQQDITAATLARKCFVTPQAMMIVLKAMEQQGLIERVPHPRHSNVLELRMTDVGREALHTARKRLDPVERRVMDAFSATDLEALQTLLSRLIKAFGE
jgi:DNA-binding MarR family transcriptional regulator